MFRAQSHTHKARTIPRVFARMPDSYTHELIWNDTVVRLLLHFLAPIVSLLATFHVCTHGVTAVPRWLQLTCAVVLATVVYVWILPEVHVAIERFYMTERLSTSVFFT
jgi:hypothetical protein